jgi:excisionase family DNA binding protein
MSPNTDPITITTDPITVSIKEAGRLSGLPRSTIYLLMNKQHLTSTKHGKRRLIYYRSLKDFLGEPPPPPAPPKRGRGRPPKVRLPATA